LGDPKKWCAGSNLKAVIIMIILQKL